MDLVVAETAHTCALFGQAAAREHPALCAALDACASRFALFTPEGAPLELPLDEAGAPRWNKLPRRRCVLWAGGRDHRPAAQDPSPPARP